MNWWPFRRRRRQVTTHPVTDKDGLYQIDALVVWVSQLTQQDVRRYRPHQEGQYRLQVVTTCLPNLIEKLDSASYTIKHDTTIDKASQCLERINEVDHEISLDDYLLDKARYPITPSSALHALQHSLEQYQRRFQVVQTHRPNRAGYYQRQYTYLLEETYQVLLGLSEVV